MDLDLLYRDFFMGDRELLFHSVAGTVPSFHDEEGNMYCAVPVFQHPDPDLARDPLSTNHRLPGTADLAKFGMMVVAGSSTDHIKVLMPDTVGSTVDADSPVVLQYVVGLSLGPLSTSVHRFRRPTWLWPCVTTLCCRPCPDNAGPTGRKSTRSCRNGRILMTPDARNVTG